LGIYIHIGAKDIRIIHYHVGEKARVDTYFSMTEEIAADVNRY
jgi:hypothetical protein